MYVLNDFLKILQNVLKYCSIFYVFLTIPDEMSIKIWNESMLPRLQNCSSWCSLAHTSCTLNTCMLNKKITLVVM